jgi:hypothetical protein
VNLNVKTADGRAPTAASAAAALQHSNFAPIPSVTSLLSFPASLRRLLREDPADNRFKAFGSKLVLLTAVALHAAGIAAEANGESPPAEILRPNSTPNWRNPWFSVHLVWTLPRSTDSSRNAVAYLASGDKLRNWRRRDDTIATHTESERTLTLPNYRSNGSRQFFKLSYELPLRENPPDWREIRMDDKSSASAAYPAG